MNLALPSSKLPLVYRHPYQGFVTSLPYIDGEIDAQTKFLVNKLIEQEMKNMEPIDYLSELPMPQTKITDHLPMEKIDFEQKPNYNDNFTTTHEIQESMEQHNISTQYAQNNIMNQELLNKYGKDSWMMLLKSQENEKARLQKEVLKQEENLNHINAQRKYEQNEVKYKLDSIKSKISDVINSNVHLEVACSELEQEIYDKQRKKLRLS